MPTTTDCTQDRSERRSGDNGRSVKKERSTLEERVTNKACINQPAPGSKGVNNRQSGRGTSEETQADTPAQSGFTYLLLDVAVGDRNGARGSVEKVLVGGHLTRLHRSPSHAQLLHGNKMKQR